MTSTSVSNEVVVPLYNERRMITAVHQAMVAFVGRHPDWCVSFVDDGSADGTAQVLGTLLAVDDAGGRIRLEALPRNVGKADAVAHGIGRATHARVFFMDGDLAYDPELLVQLSAALDHADVAIGSRGIAQGGRTPGFLRRVLGEGYNALVRSILGLPYRDTQAGIKGFRLDAAKQLFARRTSTGFGFDAELLFIANRRGMRVAEIPVRVSESHAEAGSNVRLLRDPLKMLASLMRIRLDALRGAYRS
jgi:glycosyltransferase involved in cell wall biosynthesis